MGHMSVGLKGVETSQLNALEEGHEQKLDPNHPKPSPGWGSPEIKLQADMKTMR